MVDMQEVWKLVPSECPFCREVDGKFWREFEVFAATPLYVDVERRVSRPSLHGLRVLVICTRCEEEIRSEDIRREG